MPVLMTPGVSLRRGILICLIWFCGNAQALSLPNCGKWYSFPHVPQRVMTYTNAPLENVLALGLEASLIAVIGYQAQRDSSPSLWMDLARLPRRRENAPYSAEAFLALRPDFVYSGSYYWLYSPESPDRDRLTQWGVASWLSEYSCYGQQSRSAHALSFDDIFQELQHIAQIFAVPLRGAQRIRQLREQLATLQQQAQSLPVTRMLWWYSGTYTPYVAGCCGAPGLLTRQTRGSNIFADRAELWPPVSWEVIAARDPDVLVLGDLPRGGPGDSASDKIHFLETYPLTARMRAVKMRRYVILPGYDMDPSVRTVLALERLITGLQQLSVHHSANEDF